MRLLSLTTALALVATSSLAQNACSAGKTLTDDVLTIATGNPAYFPWVLEDNPESGHGFESAVAYAVAERMGFAADQVSWVRTSFDESIQPGAKNFDFNLQQFSITEDREKVVDFSDPYYSAAMAILVRQPVKDAGAEATIAALKPLKWGAVGTYTAFPMLKDIVAPTSEPLLYNDNTDVVEALKANQIDAAIFDLPTALYLAAVTLDDGLVLGQFPADRTENPDRFGLLMEEGNPLKACVNAALGELKSDGTLAAIEAKWLAENTGVPVVE